MHWNSRLIEEDGFCCNNHYNRVIQQDFLGEEFVHSSAEEMFSKDDAQPLREVQAIIVTLDGGR